MASLDLHSPPCPSSRPPLAVFMSRFPAVTETFILREMIELERQAERVLPVPMLRESPAVLHEAAVPWVGRAIYSPFLDRAIAAAVLRGMRRHPWKMVALLARLTAGTITRPGTLLRTLAIFPKSVWLAERLQREGVLHIHAHFATYPATMAAIVSELAPITFSITVHAHDIQVDRSLLRWKLGRARFIRSISDFNRRFLERLYPEVRGRIEVIHVGIDPAAYPARPATPTNSEPRILTVAAHKPYKGLPVLIDACAILRAEGLSFRCTIVGDGPMRGALESRIRALGLDGSVSLAGSRPEKEVARMMSEADLFVLPSVVAPDGQMEGIPVALMEAMASARPVISTTISGIPELVDDGVGGLLVEPGDAAALAAAMRSLLDNPVRARRLGLQARQRVLRDFALADCTARLAALLRRESDAASRLGA